MANYTADARTNYFRVKDEDAFRKAMEPYDVSVHTRDQYFCLLADQGDCNGWPSWIIGPNDEDIEVDLPQIVAPHLCDDSVAVFIEVGAEKLRYLVGHANAVDSTGKECHITLDGIYDLAASCLQGECTQASY